MKQTYTNINWEDVELKVVQRTIKRKNIKPQLNFIGKNMYYVWKTRATWNRIVYYKWKIIWEEWDKWICEVVDQYIHNSNELFVIKSPKWSINIL